MDMYKLCDDFSKEFNVECMFDYDDFVIDYDDFNYDMVEYLEDKYLDCEIDYEFTVEDGRKLCIFKFSKLFKLSEKRQMFLDNVSCNIENQLLDILDDDNEIRYVLKNILNKIGENYE